MTGAVTGDRNVTTMQRIQRTWTAHGFKVATTDIKGLAYWLRKWLRVARSHGSCHGSRQNADGPGERKHLLERPNISLNMLRRVRIRFYRWDARANPARPLMCIW